MFSSYLVSVFRYVQKHLSTTVRHLKRLTNVAFGCVQASPMYGSLGMSAPFLHRESTDSLIITTLQIQLTYLKNRTELRDETS